MKRDDASGTPCIPLVMQGSYAIILFYFYKVCAFYVLLVVAFWQPYNFVDVL